MNRSHIQIISAIAIITLDLPCAGSSQELTAADRTKGTIYLTESRDCVFGATKVLSDAQWHFKPAPERWSIAELVEHLTLTEDYFVEKLDTELKKPPVDDTSRDPKSTDELIFSKIPDRTAKFKAPPMIIPTGRWSPADPLTRFQKDYDHLATILASSPDLRRHMLDLPPIGQKADAYEMILAVAGHNERHVKQMLEVKADAHFPLN
jgi:DinB superfamily